MTERDLTILAASDYADHTNEVAIMRNLQNDVLHQIKFNLKNRYICVIQKLSSFELFGQNSENILQIWMISM